MSERDSSGILQRAARTLGISGDSPADAARAAFLRGLPGDHFVPAEESIAAANALGAASLPLSHDGTDTAERTATEDVDGFTATYWSQSPRDRRVEWEALRAHAAPYPRVAARLRRLEAGLDVESQPHPNSKVEEMAAAVRELYLLPPRERAVRRAEWLAGQAGAVGGEFRDLADAARRLRADQPALAALEPDLMRRLTECTAAAAVPVAGLMTDDDAHGTTIDSGRDEFTGQQGYSSFVLKHRPTEADSTAGSKLGCGGSVFMVWIVLAVLRACVSSSSHPSPTYSAPKPYSPAPYTVPENRGQPPISFTQEQLAAFRRYELNPTGAPPEGYTLFRLMGGSLTSSPEFKARTGRTSATNRR